MGEHSLISPEKFDVVVVGTGLVESLVAAYVFLNCLVDSLLLSTRDNLDAGAGLPRTVA
jgi:hypothetical protein